MAQVSQWMTNALALALCLTLASAAGSDKTRGPVVSAQAREAFAKRPISFEPNHGQTDACVRFLARGHGYTLFLMPTEAVFSLRASGADRKGPTLNDRAVVRIAFIGANPDARMDALEKLPATVNYFIGNDPARWHAGVPTYGKVTYSGLYPGVDLVYYALQERLEFDFIVAPGADPGTITLGFAGADELVLDPQGDLVLQTGAGQIRLQKPRVYQEVNGARQEIAGRYELKAPFRVGVQVAQYDAARPLVIDPVLVYSTFLGGSSDPWSNQDSAYGIAVDGAGFAYIAGATSSTDFPTASPAQAVYGGGTFDAFVAKFDPRGTLIYSTFLGGSIHDTAAAIAIDADGRAYVTGFTSSPNFPTVNPFQPAKNGTNDGFVAILNLSGAALLYSTYLGGSGGEAPRGIALFSKLLSKSVPPLPIRPLVYVTGNTNSTNFPIKSAFQPAIGGVQDDAFLTILDPSKPPASQLVYSTYLGGTLQEDSRAIAIDPGGNAYLTGGTTSTNFPTKNAFQPKSRGSWEVFLTKIDPSKPPAGQLVYSTYLGGTLQDYSYAIAVDAGGSAYVTGYTFSTNFPTKNPFQPANAGAADAFVTKIDPAKPPASQLVYSTYLGGTALEQGRGITLGAGGTVVVTGDTTSPDFPTVAPLQPANQGGYDVFVVKLALAQPPAAQLIYSTYLGGTYNDFGFGIARDSLGHVFVAGATGSPTFPTKNAWQSVKGAGIDAFVTKIRE